MLVAVVATLSAPGMDVDLAVIGAGAGGLAAARAGVRRRLRVSMVTDGPIGGECTFTGCVPSKSLIEAAVRGASFAEAMARVHHNVDVIAAGDTAEVLRGEGIEVLEGRARFSGRRTLEVDGQAVRARRVVIATGDRPATPTIEGLAQGDYLTNESVFDISRAPRSLVVLGGGAMGCELGQAFARLGSSVTIVEVLGRIVADEEPETSAALADVFTAQGISLRTGRHVTRVEHQPAGSMRVWLDNGEAIAADQLLFAVGRRPDTSDLELDKAGVDLDDRGFIRTDEYLATSAPGVYAVGDIAGKVEFTHAADEMGRLAVANAFRRTRFPR
jgi:pyruvate/2-oxoglutarate dehydrogenase complex dihydrolipoamide dehydrogenase (E3) component